MKIGIIGAGFGGLAAAHKLLKEGHEVIVLEAEKKPGGLALGFKEKSWKWTIEAHYHHWFTNDYDVLELAKSVGQEVVTVKPKTSTYYDGEIKQLDSPLSLLQFSKLPFYERIRTGIVLAHLKLTPFWQPLEKVTAKKFLILSMGKTSWRVLWRPLFEKKFGEHSDSISAAWFWARIKKRTSSLSYPKGGFQSFADRLSKYITDRGGVIVFNSPVESIVKVKGKLEVKANANKYEFEKVICTLPTPLFTKITKGLPAAYKESVVGLNAIGAINLVLSLKKPFLKDTSYWLNINELDYPFLAVVEHTNFMNKTNYNNKSIVYVGNYLPHDHRYFKSEAKELVEEFIPYLKKISPGFTTSQIKKAYVFKAFYAQPIVPLNYSRILPEFKTPIEGLYLCNMQQVYPWDRGTNYAVENGKKVASLILQ